MTDFSENAATTANFPVSDSSAAPGTYTHCLPPHTVPTPPPTNDHAMRTRTKSGFRLQPKDRLSLLATSPISPIPKSYKAALLDPQWAAAMKDEYTSLIQNNRWQLVPRPHGANIVFGKWVFRQKISLRRLPSPLQSKVGLSWFFSATWHRL